MDDMNGPNTNMNSDMNANMNTSMNNNNHNMHNMNNNMNINITPSMADQNQPGQSMLPTCANCATSTTPLWRRDETGAVLCNACGLFLKLHNRPRPPSLKTDVIKSRNRVKTSIPGHPGLKKKPYNHNGMNGFPNHNGASLGQMGQIGGSDGHHGMGNGMVDDGTNPITRNGTPNMYHQLQNYDGSGLNDHSFADSSMNGSQDGPQTYEQLLAVISSLKTRVSELEVINELFRGRVTQLEHDEANAGRGGEVSRDPDEQLRQALDDSQRRESELQRTVDELRQEFAEALPHKKRRTSDSLHSREEDNQPETENTTVDPTLDPSLGTVLETSLAAAPLDETPEPSFDTTLDPALDSKLDSVQDLPLEDDAAVDPNLDPGLHLEQ